MTSWADTKGQFMNRQNDIATYVAGPMNQDITALNRAIASYIQNGGTSTGPTNPDYDTINTLSQRLALFKTQIIQLNKDVAVAIKSQGLDSDMDGLLQRNGDLQKQIAAAQATKKELSDNAGSALVRDQSLRTKDTRINNRQVYLLGHPLRPASIPYLWGLSVLFIGIAVLMLYYYSPIHIPPTEVVMGVLLEQFYNPWMWVTLLGASSIVILFLILRIMNLL
jgi:hypothetical protein